MTCRPSVGSNFNLAAVERHITPLRQADSSLIEKYQCPDGYRRTPLNSPSTATAGNSSLSASLTAVARSDTDQTWLASRSPREAALTRRRLYRRRVRRPAHRDRLPSDAPICTTWLDQLRDRRRTGRRKSARRSWRL